MTQDEMFDATVNALDAATTAMLMFRDRCAPTDLKLHWASELPTKILTREESEFRQLVEDPEYSDLCQAVRRLGQKLFDFDGVELMNGAVGNLSSRPDGGRKIAIVDSAWDGIGKAWH